MVESMHDYYACPGPATDPGPYAELYKTLPGGVPQVVRTVQGLQVHVFWLPAYRINPPQARRDAEVNLRTVRRRLARLLELDPAPLKVRRPPERRLIGNCRDFSLMTASILKAKGIPARARCGFGTYFTPGHFEDHWVVEYRDASLGRWVMVDSQLDARMQRALHLDFDPLDMPPGKFITGGRAWLMCRREGADPDKFGIFQYKGWDFVRGDLLRDALALNNLEVLPWDFWPAMATPVADLSPNELARLDYLAGLTSGGPGELAQGDFEAVREAYAAWPEVHAPVEWFE